MKISQIPAPKGIECCHEIRADDVPRCLKESCREAIRLGRFVRVQRPDGFPDFILSEATVKTARV
jgi:hypothetical protein